MIFGNPKLERFCIGGYQTGKYAKVTSILLSLVFYSPRDLVSNTINENHLELSNCVWVYVVNIFLKDLDL